MNAGAKAIGIMSIIYAVIIGIVVSKFVSNNLSQVTELINTLTR